MNKDKIAQLLNQLQEELGDADGLDPALSERLRSATAAIHEALDRDPAVADEQEQPHGMIEQLRDAATQFEDSHPTLTNTVGRIADALSQLGI
jgi:ABC-type transporter Mla subunit MlaD